MKMKKWQSKSKSNDLANLGRAFGKFRNGNTNKIRRYPLRLRRNAVGTLNLGFNASEVARASGVNVQSILNWRKDLSLLAPPPKELEIEDESMIATPVDEVARVFLRSGVCIELSAKALTASFFKRIIGDAP